MAMTLLFLLLGVGAGAVYAALGLGLVMVYRGCGVLNMAQGAMAMLPALTFVTLRRTGTLVLPWIWLPHEVHLGQAPTVVCIVLALGVAALVGLAAHAFVFEPIRDRSPVTKVVASVGLTIVLEAIAILNFGPGLQTGKAIFPDGNVRVFGQPVPQDRLFLAAVVILVAAALWALYRWTHFGLVTRAAAESEKGALLLGYSPRRISGANWVLSSLLAGLAGILITPVSGVTPFNYSLFVVPALAAALAGRFRSFPVTCATAFALGMFQALVVRLVSFHWVPRFVHAGLDSALPFLVIVVVLAVVGQALPPRGTYLADRQARAPLVQPTLTRLGPWVAMALLVMGVGASGIRLALIHSLIMAVLVLSLVVLTGYVGQVSLAQMAFAGFGAFMLARFANDYGIPFPVSPLLAIATTTAFGVILGLAAARIRGVQLAAVTLAFAGAIEQLLFRNNSFTGFGGISTVPNPRLLGLDLGILGGSAYPQRAFGLLVVAVAAAACLVVINVRRAGCGRTFLAVRVNERAAASIGVDVVKTKLLANGLASFLAGLAGVLIGYQLVQFSAEGFDATAGLALLAVAYLGGIASVRGAIIAGLLAPAGVVFYVLSELTGGRPADYQFLLTGVALIVATSHLPEGLAGLFERRERPARILSRPAPSRARPPRQHGVSLPSIELLGMVVEPVTEEALR